MANEFKVGDKVRVLRAKGWPNRFETGDIFTVIKLHFDHSIYIDDGQPEWCNNNRFELVEEEPVLPILAEPVLFIFIKEAESRLRPGTKVVAANYGLVPFNSLEEAQEHCVQLREQHREPNIFAYVRVE